MKKVIVAFISALILTSCGVGNYSVSSGKADEGMLSFTSASKTSIVVTVDNEQYDIYTVETKAWRRDRNIKKTAQNTISLTTGQHNVEVSINGNPVYRKKIFLSAQEHKVIEL